MDLRSRRARCRPTHAAGHHLHARPARLVRKKFRQRDRFWPRRSPRPTTSRASPTSSRSCRSTGEPMDASSPIRLAGLRTSRTPSPTGDDLLTPSSPLHRPRSDTCRARPHPRLRRERARAASARPSRHVDRWASSAPRPVDLRPRPEAPLSVVAFIGSLLSWPHACRSSIPLTPFRPRRFNRATTRRLRTHSPRGGGGHATGTLRPPGELGPLLPGCRVLQWRTRAAIPASAELSPERRPRSSALATVLVRLVEEGSIPPGARARTGPLLRDVIRYRGEAAGRADR